MYGINQTASLVKCGIGTRWQGWDKSNNFADYESR